MQSSLEGARHAGRRSTAVIAAAASLILVVLVGIAPAGATVSFINQNRSGSGLAPVDHHDGLASLAAQQAQAMAEEGRLFHTSGLGGKVSTVIPDWQAVAENVGMGDSMEQVNDAFMQSSSHRANILGDFNLAGVASATDGEGRVWVSQIFTRVPAEPPPPPPPPAPEPPPPPVDERVIVPRASRTAPRSEPAPAPVPEVATFTSGVLAGPALGRWREGYLLFDTDGGVFAHAGAAFAGSIAGTDLAAPVVGGASTPRGDGYWLASEDGGVFALGEAPFLGSVGGTPLTAGVVGLAPARSRGYWLAAADGGVFAFGDARYYGGLANAGLDGTVAAIASTPSGQGYWLASDNGGVFAFGDAPHFGALADAELNAPVTAIASTPSGRGYWLAGADGGVFAFGDATHVGGLAGDDLQSPIRAIVPQRSGSGYRLVTEAGEVFSFGGGDTRTSSRGYVVYASLFLR